MAAERVLVARVGAAQGLRGEVRLWAFTADPMAVKGYGPFEAVDGRRLVIEALRPGKSFMVARFAGVNDRTAAAQILADIAHAARPTEQVERAVAKLAKQAKSGNKRRRHKLTRAWKTFEKAERFWR